MRILLFFTVLTHHSATACPNSMGTTPSTPSLPFTSLWVSFLPYATLSSLDTTLSSFLALVTWLLTTWLPTWLPRFTAGYLGFRLMEGGWWTFFKWFQWILLTFYYRLMTSKPHQSYRQDVRFWIPQLSITIPNWYPTHSLGVWHRKRRPPSSPFGHHQYGIRIRLRYKYVVLRHGNLLLHDPDFQPIYVRNGLSYVVLPAKYVLKTLRDSILSKLERRRRLKVATSRRFPTASHFDAELYDKALHWFTSRNSPFWSTKDYETESFFDVTLFDRIYESRRATSQDLRAVNTVVTTHFDTSYYQSELDKLALQREHKLESEQRFQNYYGMPSDLAWTIFDTYMDPLDWY